MDTSSCPADGFATVRADLAQGGSDPFVGRVFEGRYRVEARIGGGGFGTVYRAVQLAMDRRVAIKLLRRELSSDLESVKRFQVEARACAMLEHPNSLRVFDFGQSDDGYLFLVTELVEGEVLSKVLKREKALVPGVAAEVVVQILHALGEAHERGIVHRDLKPDNVFLKAGRGGAASVKVLDFGIAKLVSQESPVESLTKSGVIVGTPHYMSPEQAKGGAVDGRSDLYALGIMLYQMVSGRLPFDATTPLGIVLAHIQDPPPPLTMPDGGAVPSELGTIVTDCLAKSPTRRPASAEALRARLEAFLGQRSVVRPALRADPVPAAGGAEATLPMAGPASVETGASAARKQGSSRAKTLAWALVGGLAATAAVVLISRPWGAPQEPTGAPPPQASPGHSVTRVSPDLREPEEETRPTTAHAGIVSGPPPAETPRREAELGEVRTLRRPAAEGPPAVMAIASPVATPKPAQPPPKRVRIEPARPADVAPAPVLRVKKL